MTEWPAARTPDGYASAKTLFPKHLEASLVSIESAPSNWSHFIQQYHGASAQDRVVLMDAMKQHASQITDTALRMKMLDAVDECTEAVSAFSEQ